MKVETFRIFSKKLILYSYYSNYCSKQDILRIKIVNEILLLRSCTRGDHKRENHNEINVLYLPDPKPGRIPIEITSRIYEVTPPILIGIPVEQQKQQQQLRAHERRVIHARENVRRFDRIRRALKREAK